jgi:type II secretory pathway pseudopilin PulG
MNRSSVTAPAAAFTTIELLIVVALAVGVGALLTSAYRTFSVRAEVAASIDQTGPLRDAVAAAYGSSGEAPAAVSGPTPALRAGIASASVSDGRIDIVFGPDADPALTGRRLPLTPYESADGQVEWVCGNQIPGLGLQPLGFAAGGRQAVQIPATVELRYLPSQCR